MRTYTLIFLFFLCLPNAQSQDTIILKDGRIIYADIIEKSNTKITYKFDSIRNNHYSYHKISSLASQNPREMFPLGISGTIAPKDYRTFLFGISIDYLFTPNISAEFNLGDMIYMSQQVAPAFRVLSLGSKYWFANKHDARYLSPFLGLFFGSFFPYDSPPRSPSFFAEFPVGISYIVRSGFQATLQLGYLYYNFSSGIPSVEFRLGWRFKANKK